MRRIRSWLGFAPRRTVCRFCRHEGCQFCVGAPTRPEWGDPLGMGVRVIQAAASTTVRAAKAIQVQLPPWEPGDIYSSI